MDDITDFVLNTNLDKEMHSFPEVQLSVKEAAEAIAARARELAPVASGAYRDGIVVNKAQNVGGVWRVAATDQKSAWVEFGTYDQPPQFIMRQAVQSLGLSFKKSS